MADDKRFNPQRLLSIVLSIVFASPFIVTGSFLCLYAVVWEIGVIGARNGSAIGPCDPVGTSAYLVGVGLVGIGFFVISGMIIACAVYQDGIHLNSWISTSVLMFGLGIVLFLFGFIFGDGCALIN